MERYQPSVSISENFAYVLNQWFPVNLPLHDSVFFLWPFLPLLCKHCMVKYWFYEYKKTTLKKKNMFFVFQSINTKKLTLSLFFKILIHLQALKGLPPNFASSINRIWANQRTYISPEIIRKSMAFDFFIFIPFLFRWKRVFIREEFFGMVYFPAIWGVEIRKR